MIFAIYACGHTVQSTVPIMGTLIIQVFRHEFLGRWPLIKSDRVAMMGRIGFGD